MKIKFILYWSYFLISLGSCTSTSEISHISYEVDSTQAIVPIQPIVDVTLKDTNQKVIQILKELKRRCQGYETGHQYKPMYTKIYAINYSDDKFKEAYSQHSVAHRLDHLIGGKTYDIAKQINKGRKKAIKILENQMGREESRKKHLRGMIQIYQNLLWQGINPPDSSLPDSSATPILNRILPHWPQYLHEFAHILHPAAIYTTYNYAKRDDEWQDVAFNIYTWDEMMDYPRNYLILKLARVAPQYAQPVDSATIQLWQRAMADQILQQTLPTLAQQGLLKGDTLPLTDIQKFAQRQLLIETIKYARKYNTQGQVAYKAYLPDAQLSTFAEQAWQQLLQQGFPLEKTLYQGAYDPVYQNLQSTLRYMGLSYDFSQADHQRLRHTNAFGTKDQVLRLKLIDQQKFRQALTKGVPAWDGLSSARFPDKNQLKFDGPGVDQLIKDGSTPVSNRSGLRYLDFKQLTVGTHLWIRISPRNLIKSQTGSYYDIRFAELHFKAEGIVYTINNLAHAGKQTYGPKTIKGSYKVRIAL